jgi:hypothetical protein
VPVTLNIDSLLPESCTIVIFTITTFPVERVSNAEAEPLYDESHPSNELIPNDPTICEFVCAEMVVGVVR